MYVVSIRGRMVDLEQVAADHRRQHPDAKAIVFPAFGVWTDGHGMRETEGGLIERLVASGVRVAVLSQA